MAGDMVIREDFYADESTLDEVLAELERFGYPRVGKFDTGWHCKVEVIVTPAGVDFEVKSDYGLLNPLCASQQCYSRLKTAIEELINNGIQIRRVK